MFQIISRDFAPVSYGFLRPLLRQLDDVLDEPSAREALQPRQADLEPAYDLEELDEHYLLSLDVPGVRSDDLSVELTGNRLVVAGERKAAGTSAGRRHGKFQRVFTLPDGISADHVTAEHKDGVLELLIQKPKAAKATRIRIGDGIGKAGVLKNLGGADDKSEPVAAASQA